jgi:hypothetical protein
MPLIDVDLSVEIFPIPDDVQRLLDEAETRIQRFLSEHRAQPVHGFVPCDFVRVYSALRAVVEANETPGHTFCEWGSGMGVVACLASMLDFTSYGIEIRPELVEEAESLAADFGLDVEYACATFVPPGAEELTDHHADFDWLESGGADGYDDLDLDPRDLHLVFVYPWPGQEVVVRDIFEVSASTGALLMVYQGIEDLSVHRKV